MRKTIKITFAAVLSTITLILFLSVVPANAAQDSKGTEFFLLFQTNISTPDNLNLFITGDINTAGIVEVPGASISIPFTVTAGNITTISLPTSLHALGNNTVMSNKGIHVVANDEVTVYGLNRLKYSTDAYLGLPVDILNKDYLVLSHSGGYTTGNQSQFAIIAAYDGTQVKITPSVAAAGHAAGVAYTINLNKFATYQLQAPAGSADLTGTEIHANNPIAVFAGNVCDNLPGQPYIACDHCVEQLFPEATWGTAFLSFPLATRTGGDTFRTIASENNTAVNINGTSFILNRGHVDDRILTTSAVISSDKPIMVAQYSNSSSFDGVTSDPFMMLLPPYEQFLRSYTFSTPASGFSGNYVNIVVPDSAVGGVTLDGLLVSAATFSPIGLSGYSGAAIPIALGSHTVSCSEPLGIHAYGFDSYDSYGYPGGLALKFIYPRGDENPPIVTGSLIDCKFNGTAKDNRPSEDVNKNGALDPGEDLNGNGKIDEDTGVFLVELKAGSTNLAITVDSFIPGTFDIVNFSVSLIDPNVPGSGFVVVTDGAGNTTSIEVNIVCRECVTGATKACATGEPGVCAAGTQTCQADGFWGSCVANQKPSPEVCDGLDNDCDGLVDNGLLPTPTTCGVGACASTGTLSCVNGAMVDSCKPGKPGVEVCNGLDDDCDGVVDNRLPSTPTTCGVGACASTGTLSCVNGAMVDSCKPGTPGVEVCNGLDDDCNGSTDENYVFGGFQQPINSDGSSIFKAGRTIPVKVVITDCSGQSCSAGTVILAVSKVSSLISGSEVEILPESSGSANTDDLFRCADGKYIYNLSTKGYTEGTYKVYAKTNDGKSYSVNFSLK